MRKDHRSFFILFFLIVGLVALGFLPENAPVQAQRTDPSFQAFNDPLDAFNTTLWHKADGWANGDPFDCGWQADNVTFADGAMSLQIDNMGCPCSDRPYAAGEYRSNGHYLYGTYAVTMKAVAQEGVVSSFFIYTGPSEGNPWDEIDIEITGKNPTQLQTNYYTNGVGGHESLIALGFDASADFHTYSIEWLPDRIHWYVDGALKHTENGSNSALPTTPGRIMMNFWPGTGTIHDWLGDFVYSSPIQAQYTSVSFTPLDMPIKNYLPLVVR